MNVINQILISSSDSSHLAFPCKELQKWETHFPFGQLLSRIYIEKIVQLPVDAAH